jgi:hypothetical protein
VEGDWDEVSDANAKSCYYNPQEQQLKLPNTQNSSDHTAPTATNQLALFAKKAVLASRPML